MSSVIDDVLGVEVVREMLALSGAGVPALHAVLTAEPGAGLARALLALAVGETGPPH